MSNSEAESMHLNRHVNEVTLPVIQIFGLGYIGLPTAAIMADAGFRVLGVDVVESVVNTVNEGNIHIVEDGLEVLVKDGVASGRLSASTSAQLSDVHIIAVPTPIYEDKSPDISFVIAAAKSISQVLRPGDLIVIESTIPPMTCEGVVAPLLKNITGLSAGADYHLVHCPERVIPGRILHELIYNDRIIGGMSEVATKRAADIYGVFVKGNLLLTTATVAEMCKLMENTYRDVNIALANEFAAIGDTLGFDVFKAIELANHHPRVNIHAPSIGVGGHCIPVDPWFIVNAAPAEARIIKMAREINDNKSLIVAERILSFVTENSIKRIGVLGLTYKPNVDDLRESPAIRIVETLANNTDINVVVSDPLVDTLPQKLLLKPNITFTNVDSCISDCQVLVFLVEHEVFKGLNLDGKIILNIYNNFYSESVNQVTG